MTTMLLELPPRSLLKASWGAWPADEGVLFFLLEATIEFLNAAKASIKGCVAAEMRDYGLAFSILAHAPNSTVVHKATALSRLFLCGTGKFG